MSINILIFGSLAEIIGSTALQVEAERVDSTEKLHEYLGTNFPGLQQKSYKLAVNQQIASEGQPLKAGDEVALLPPFSGG